MRRDTKNETEDSKNKIGVVSKIFKIIFFTIAIIILLIAGTIMIKANINPDKVPDIFGYKPMIVLSGSMETSIHTGDLVFVKMVDTTTLKNGDVIAFRNEENTVTTHRIIEIIYENGKQYFKTKGDANTAEDLSLVEMEDVEGIYVGRLAKVGNFLMFMQKPIGLCTVLLTILVIGLIWLYLVNKKDEKEYRKMDEKERLEFEEFKRQKEEAEKQKEVEKQKENK